MFSAELSQLRANLSSLPARDQEFARSLLDQMDRRGSLSDKQWPWIKTLAARLPGASAGVTTLGDPAALLQLFARAAATLQFPSIVMALPSGEAIKLWIAGPRSRAPGSVTVALRETRVRLGTLNTDGTWSAAPIGRDDMAASVATLLSRLLADPMRELAAHGRQLGACCYCRIELTDPRSLAAGYGPVCARKWGLAWGGKAAA